MVEFLVAALPFLAFLACPLMMLVCVAGMRKAGCDAPRASVEPAPALTRDARVAALESQLAVIQSELLALRAEEVQQSPGRQVQHYAGSASIPEANDVAHQSA